MTCCAVSRKSCKRGSLLSVAHKGHLLRKANSLIGTTDRLVIYFLSTAYKLPFTIQCWVQNCSCCMSTDLTRINGTEMLFSPVFWWRLVQTLGCVWINVCSLSVHVLMTAHFYLHVFERLFHTHLSDTKIVWCHSDWPLFLSPFLTCNGSDGLFCPSVATKQKKEQIKKFIHLMFNIIKRKGAYKIENKNYWERIKHWNASPISWSILWL